eukprot:Awhi_evm1s6085
MYRHLSTEIGQTFASHREDDKKEGDESDKKEDDKEEEDDKIPLEPLVELAKQIVPYSMKHNAESEACDLLMEIEKLDILEAFVEKEDYQRVCLYLE